MGYLLYREIRDYAPADWTAGERLVALMIADDASDTTRASWIRNELLCHRTGLRPSGVKAALQKLAGRGYEMRVSHGKDALGRPMYAVRGHRTEYLVPGTLTLIGAATAPPIPVDNPPERRGRSPAKRRDIGGAVAPDGGAVASHGGAAVSPISSGLLRSPQTPNGPDLTGPVEGTPGPRGPDPDFPAAAAGA